MIPVGTSYHFPVQFNDSNGVPLQTDDCLIFIQDPAGTVTSAAGVWDADTRTFMRPVTITAGTYFWWGTTTDLDASAGRTETGMVVSAAAGGATVDELVAVLRGRVVRVESPIQRDGSIRLVRGDSYQVADGRGIAFDLDNPPYDLTGATAEFVVDGIAYPMSIAGDILTLELTSLQTTGMTFGAMPYFIRITQPDLDVITPERGTLVVVPYP